jgi:hypothetical protein
MYEQNLFRYPAFRLAGYPAKSVSGASLFDMADFLTGKMIAITNWRFKQIDLLLLRRNTNTNLAKFVFQCGYPYVPSKDLHIILIMWYK